MAELLRIANAQSRPVRHGDFVETETARDIRRSFDLVRTLTRELAQSSLLLQRRVPLANAWVAACLHHRG